MIPISLKHVTEDLIYSNSALVHLVPDSQAITRTNDNPMHYV